MLHKSISIWFNRFSAFSLLAALIVSLVQVSPAYAASIVVNTGADNYANDGKCTLREAIDAANTNARSGTAAGECAAGSAIGVDAISFNPSFAPYLITAGSGGTPLKQLPYIVTPITISGLGAATTVIQAAGTPNTATWRIFQVTPAGTLTLDGVTVQNGQCDTACTTIGGVEANAGGAIHNSGVLTVKNSIIKGNRGTLGGAIYNLGTLTVENSTLLENEAFRILTADDGGGAIYNGGTLIITNNSLVSKNSADKNGGAIFNAVGSNLTITGSTISENTGYLGGGIFNNQGTLTVTDSIISDNVSSQGICCDDGGGGIRNVGTLTVTNSIFSGNDAKGGGAILNLLHMTVKDSTFSGNTGGYGGGINNGDCISTNLCTNNDATIINTVFSNNSVTRDGGAIYNNYTSTLKILDSTFLNNTSDLYGGAISNLGAPMEINGSTFSGNIATSQYGGAIHNQNYWQNVPNRPANISPTVTNTTFYGNLAGAGGGGIAIRYAGTSIVVTNSTFSGNDGGSGGSIYNESKQNVATTLKNTIVANSTSGRNCTGTIVNGGNNLQFGGGVADSCGAAIPTSNPQLGPLADNGGPTQTMALLPGSPAIDAGNDATCPTADQIGLFRPQGSHCDIGAFEYRMKTGGDTTGVFRPSNGLLYLKYSNTTGFADVAINYGLGGDYPVVGDWDGNGTVTIGIYRNGSFYLRNENSLGFADLVFAFGVPGDQPVAGDWDGDGVDTIGVYRSSTGLFLLRNSNTTGDAEMSFYLGNPGDVGIAGDWNGDGKDTTGVFRPSNGFIFLKNTNDTGFADVALNYGLAGDQPLIGDWNDDGIDTIGIYRGGSFYLRNRNTNGFANMIFALGIPGDHPIAGNWDGQP